MWYGYHLESHVIVRRHLHFNPLLWNHRGARVAQWVRSLDLTTRTNQYGVGSRPAFVKYKKGCTRLAAASDKDYQLLAHGQWFSPGTPASSTTKTGRHDIHCSWNIVESGVKTPKINQSIWNHWVKWNQTWYVEWKIKYITMLRNKS